MRINNSFNLNSLNNKKQQNFSSKNIAEQKSIQTASLEGLDVQGRAQVVLNNSEFEQLKKEFLKKVETLPNDMKTEFKTMELNKYNINIAFKIIENEENFELNSLICRYVNTKNKLDLANKILTEPQYQDKNIFPYLAGTFMFFQNDDKVMLADKVISNEKFYKNEIFLKKFVLFLTGTNTKEKIKIANEILDNKTVQNNNIYLENAADIFLNTKNLKQAQENLQLLESSEFSPSQILCRIENPNLNDNLIKMNKLINKTIIDKLPLNETRIAATFIDLYKKQNINELPVRVQKEFLNNLTSSNSNLFNIAENMKSLFPLLPSTQEEYCSLLPNIVYSINESKKILSSEEINQFNKSLSQLTHTVSHISNEEFKKLEITQSYSKDDFIIDVLENLQELTEPDKKEIYDYFGFELKENSKTKTGFSIKGYITKQKETELPTKNSEVIEKIHRDIIKFTEDNKIICSNKNLEEKLNEIIKYIPELRVMIGCIQAGMNNTEGSHQYDIFKHSLKVLQGIVQNPEFLNLKTSDKRIMILSAFLHDITKKEGYIDASHADNSALDALLIISRFNLDEEEKIKLYNIIKHHEWLGGINRSKNQEELDKRLQYSAYDFRHDNTFEMALMFTHADLKGVNDNFHDTLKGDLRIDFNGTTRSFGEAADFYAKDIKKYIKILKTTQPILPVTKIPKASTINNAISKINADGSTNIKGIYKDKDGLIIIKYNELENSDLEKLGFPKGSKVSGIKTTTNINEEINTGNIKFFVHGLDFPNQLTRFDGFSSIDSDALLSVSYA